MLRRSFGTVAETLRDHLERRDLGGECREEKSLLEASAPR
jgi:hypothetical protein